jgi:hypothetical protein
VKRIILFFLIAALFISCANKSKKTSPPVRDSTALKVEHNDSLLPNDMVSSANCIFFADSLLHGHKDVLKYYFSKYLPDSCTHFHSSKSELIKNFEGVVFIGDINYNRIPDSVFVLEPITYCRFKEEKDFEGDAYYFTDTTLPRLQTGSECCHPENIFLVEDIDEDGISEIGQFFSSCASHYKSLYVYSLKNKQWKEIGHSCFDLYYMDVKKPFSYWVKKTGKNKFEMLQITDLTTESKIGKKDWVKFSMED